MEPDKRRKLEELIARDEKARQILRSFLANRARGGRHTLPFRVTGSYLVLDKLRELEVINNEGELICQPGDIRDMLGGSPKSHFSREYIEPQENPIVYEERSFIVTPIIFPLSPCLFHLL